MTQEKLPHRKELCLQSERRITVFTVILLFIYSIFQMNCLFNIFFKHSILLPPYVPLISISQNALLPAAKEHSQKYGFPEKLHLQQIFHLL